jgi:hypothetical protein
VSSVGGYDEALKDFNSMDLDNARSYLPTDRQQYVTTVGELSDGRVVNVRPTSSTGSPTLEISGAAQERSIKIRY